MPEQQTMEKQSIFREKSLSKVSSPEQLNDYIRVSTPAVWLVLGAIVLLLIAVTLWGFLGRLESPTENGGTESIAPIEFVIN